jgi:hypothetical protein
MTWRCIGRLTLVTGVMVMLLAFGAPMLAQSGSPAPAATPSAAVPDPVPASLDPTTTAFLALDFTDRICAPQPACVAVLANVANGLAAARAEGALVVYSTTPGGTVVSDLTPQPGDPILSSRADKFFHTDLDAILQQAGITTLVITGTASNGAVLYTAFAANERGYTVVVATDGISASNDIADFVARYQLLNQPGFSNPQNTPLKPNAVTLSRIDLISFTGK